MKTFGELPASYEVSMSYEEQIELLTRKINEIIDELKKYTPIDNLSKVAFTGNYNDLINKPDLSQFITKDVNNLTYYTKTSDLSTVATSGDYDDLSNKPTIPTKTSQLTNDSDFTTKAYVDELVGDINTALDTINGEVI